MKNYITCTVQVDSLDTILQFRVGQKQESKYSRALCKVLLHKYKVLTFPLRIHKVSTGVAVYNHWTGLVDWTGGLDWWTDTKNHFYTFL